MSLFWQRLVTAVGVLLVTTVAAKLVDWRISKRSLDPSVATRYRVLRRTLMAAIVFVGILSALLVIPQIRTVAGGVLAERGDRPGADAAAAASLKAFFHLGEQAGLVALQSACKAGFFTLPFDTQQ